MLKQRPRKNPETGLYYPNLVPMAAIRRYARAIAERFHPEKIILFGSYAYGKPNSDSDVDLLVVMPTRSMLDQPSWIIEKLENHGIKCPFFMDLLVRTPRVLEQRLRWGDWFLREIMERGQVLYDRDARVMLPSPTYGTTARLNAVGCVKHGCADAPD